MLVNIVLDQFIVFYLFIFWMCGIKVVSAYVFEQHAGSTKKHPADFIYLQNGNSLHDVVKACHGAPLDMLEAAIQGAIGPVPPKKCFTCQKCKGDVFYFEFMN